MTTLAALMRLRKADLVNRVYNDQISDLESVEEYKRAAPNGKPVPYMGWWWRSCDFVGGRVTIAAEGDYVAVCRSNKWGYPQRYMTPEEVAEFVRLLDAAFVAKHEGFSLADEMNARLARLAELREWMQSLDVPEDHPW